MKRPRPPNRAHEHDVSAWLRYYQRMEQWNTAAAADLDDYPTSQALVRDHSRRFRLAVTEVLIGAHWAQVHGDWL